MSNGSSCQCGQGHVNSCATEFQYAVKAVCGRVTPSPTGAPLPVAPGQYWTAVNIHNPSKCRGASFRWKVTVARPGEPGRVSPYRNERLLEPDRSLEIDSAQIMNAVGAGFVKGYVVIESDIELDVVAVYTSAPAANSALNSFHTERVEPRCVPVCEELLLPLHTGLADWRTVSAPPGSGPLGPAVPVSSQPWAPPPAGSLWVSQTATDGQVGTLIGTRRYDLCFDLCFGFTVPPNFNIQVMADDSATVTLNGSNVGNVPIPGYNSPTTLTVNTQLLQPGRNCFSVSVLNGPPPGGGGPTAFALAGILRVARGRCPCSPLPLRPMATGGGGLPTVAGEAGAAESRKGAGARKALKKGAKKSSTRKRTSRK